MATSQDVLRHWCRLCLILWIMLLPFSEQVQLENVALRKPCNISSTYYEANIVTFRNPCSAAINGNTRTVYEDGNCIHTRGADEIYPHWTVNLGHVYVIHKITIYARAGFAFRMHNTTVSLDNRPPVYTITSPLNPSGAKFNIPVSPPRLAYTVTLARLDSSRPDDHGTSTFLNFCEVQVWGLDPCSSSPCLNSGSCTNTINDSYVCLCTPGYTGSRCETDINDCSPDPCENGGNCTDGINSYTCTCQAGYTGDTCQTDINDCSPDPCENRGNCTDGINSYTCTCQAGYTGDTCHTDVNDCSPNPCANSGNCTDGINSYTCTCQAGYTGDTCHTECEERQFGVNCSDTCSAGCQGGTCSPSTGDCTIALCLPGYLHTPMCDIACDSHHYGVNCSHVCGGGCEGGSCDSHTGHCIVHTCLPGYLQSPTCDQVIVSTAVTNRTEESHDVGGDSNSLVTNVLIGVGVSVGVVVVLAFVVWFCKSRVRSPPDKSVSNERCQREFTDLSQPAPQSSAPKPSGSTVPAENTTQNPGDTSRQMNIYQVPKDTDLYEATSDHHQSHVHNYYGLGQCKTSLQDTLNPIYQNVGQDDEIYEVQ